MAWVGIALALYINHSGWPLKKVVESFKKTAAHEMKILAISSFVLLTVIVGWWQTGFDDVIAYCAGWLNVTYEEKFFQQGQLNFILAIFGLTVQFIVNAIYKRFVKPNKF